MSWRWKDRSKEVSTLACTQGEPREPLWRLDIQPNDTQYNDTQQNDTQHNDTRHNDTQHNDTRHNDTRHNDTKHNDSQHQLIKCDTQHNGSVVMLTVIYAECKVF